MSENEREQAREWFDKADTDLTSATLLAGIPGPPETICARIADTPARRDELVRGEYTWEAGEYGEGQVGVKIVDVLDEEWFGMIKGLENDSPATRTRQPDVTRSH